MHSLLAGSLVTAISVYVLLPLVPKAVIAPMLALLLASLARRVGQRSRFALVLIAALQSLIALLLLREAAERNELLTTAAGVLHLGFGLIALAGLQVMANVDVAELAAARPALLAAETPQDDGPRADYPTADQPSPDQPMAEAAAEPAAAPQSLRVHSREPASERDRAAPVAPPIATSMAAMPALDRDPNAKLQCCPKCHSDQVESAVCSGCGFDLERYRRAALRVIELERKLGRSPRRG